MIECLDHLKVGGSMYISCLFCKSPFPLGFLQQMSPPDQSLGSGAVQDIYHVLSCGCFGAEVKWCCDRCWKQDTWSYCKDYIRMILLMFIHADYKINLWAFLKNVYLSFFIISLETCFLVVAVDDDVNCSSTWWQNIKTRLVSRHLKIPSVTKATPHAFIHFHF